MIRYIKKYKDFVLENDNFAKSRRALGKYGIINDDKIEILLYFDDEDEIEVQAYKRKKGSKTNAIGDITRQVDLYSGYKADVYMEESYESGVIMIPKLCGIEIKGTYTQGSEDIYDLEIKNTKSFDPCKYVVIGYRDESEEHGNEGTFLIKTFDDIDQGIKYIEEKEESTKLSFYMMDIDLNKSV
jgi:hypothetical protein